MKTFNTLVVTASLASALLLTAGCSKSVEQADLDRVLDISYDSLYRFESSSENTKDDAAMDAFASELRYNFASANPPAHSGPIGITLKEDGSFDGYQDSNRNEIKDEGEADLFKVEIDGESSRLIATDTSGNVRDHHFSGSGMLAGYLIGSMLGRQRGAGISPSSLSGKTATPKSAYQSARSRSGSGSHSSGK